MVDLIIGGWKLSEKTAKDLAYNIENVMDDADPATTTIILYMFDHIMFLGDVDGNLMALDCERAIRSNHMPIMRAARGAELLIISPLPRFLVKKCCGDPGHIYKLW